MPRLAHTTVAVLALTFATQAAGEDRPTFEVASIKANRGGDPRRGARVLPGGRIEITNLTLCQMIRIAYGSTTIQSDEQVAGGDVWVGTERFDVLAKVEGEPGFDNATNQPVRLIAMVRSLLEDRFKVIVQRDRSRSTKHCRSRNRSPRRSKRRTSKGSSVVI